jgi:hypothetical protein
MPTTEFEDFKTPIYTGVNDVPRSPTSSQAGNASDLIDRCNGLIDQIVTSLDTVALKSEVTALTNSIDALQASIPVDNSSSIAALQTALTDLGSVVTTLPTTVAIAVLQTQITSLAASITVLNTQVVALGASGTNIQSGGGGTGSTASDPLASSVKLLMHFEGADSSTNFVDEKNNTIGISGDAIVSTSRKKIGSSSLRLNGTNAALVIPKSAVNLAGVTDFCIEAWMFPNSLSGTLFTTYNVTQGSQGDALLAEPTRIRVCCPEILTNLVVAQWQHLAFTREGTTYRIFKNGVLQGTSVSNNALAQGGNLYVGGSPGDNNIGNTWFDGFIDELRVTVNEARYTTDFVPTTIAYSLA